MFLWLSAFGGWLLRPEMERGGGRGRDCVDLVEN